MRDTDEMTPEIVDQLLDEVLRAPLLSDEAENGVVRRLIADALSSPAGPSVFLSTYGMLRLAREIAVKHPRLDKFGSTWHCQGCGWTSQSVVDFYTYNCDSDSGA